MRKRNNFSISTFLVSALGLLIFFKVFIKILENFVFKTVGDNSLKVDESDLNIALVVVLLLLLMRGLYIFWRFKNRKVSAAEEIDLSLSQSRNESYQCEKCGKTVSEKVRSYCLDRPEKYKGKVYCYDHQFR